MEVPPCIVTDRNSIYGVRTYISLFSSAGVGCYGFKQEGFQCIASVELLEKRLKIQRFNNKCVLDSGYICGDMTQESTHEAILREYNLWHDAFGVNELDVLIATPPCQGMSVANHKKRDELRRNSLVVESIKMVDRLEPRFFVFENVRGFLTSICTDVDGQDKTIASAIDLNLSGNYNILCKVVNFKDYGSPSSRTRTLVIGVRKDQIEITPFDIFPDKQKEKTLRETIGHLPSLTIMGEVWAEDIYHNFRKYDPRMIAWIENIKEGQSAFDNTEANRLPHRIKDGVVIYNTNKNGDKYTRQRWDKVAPCIHTRNDILASQNTVHPDDNRVFSIREIMLMMSVPESFNWTNVSFGELNALSDKDKIAFLKKEEMNIRQNLGEAVPTVIFQQIARKIRKLTLSPYVTNQEVENIIKAKKLTDRKKLLAYLNGNLDKPFAILSKIAELSNAMRADNAAYYTRQDLCFAIIKNLPDAKGLSSLRILEPSIGVGNFLPMLIAKYCDVQSVTVDVVDIDPQSLEVLKILIKSLNVPSNFTINYLEGDFLLMDFSNKYDIVLGNPPYMKITKDKDLLSKYKADKYNTVTNNIFSFFIEKALTLGDVVSLIVPKSLINAPEFNLTRELLNKKSISCILDFGEKGFKGVKIETICLVVDTQKKPNQTRIESYITYDVRYLPQSYITDKTFPYWLIYRNSDFDEVANKMCFDIFQSYRDRAITQAKTKKKGRIRVLKSRNIADNQIINIPGYDTYIDNAEDFDVSKYMDMPNCVLVPNLTYNPRACFLPKGCITDGSVAILTLKDPATTISSDDLAFFATSTFNKFYSIARNRGTRSLNIDNNSVFFFGINRK